MKERSSHVDIAKGMAMICIIIGHLGENTINRVVFTFHVPIFFLITGFYVSRKQTVRDFIISKAKRLLVPYVITCIFMIVLGAGIGAVRGGRAAAWNALKQWTYASLYGAGGNFQEPFYIKGIGALWFLWAMFWACCILRVLLEKGTVTRLLTVLIVFLVSRWTVRLFWFPLSIQAGGVALFFLYAGYLAKQALPYLKQLSLEVRAACSVFAGIVWFMFIRDFKSFWLVQSDIGRGVTDLFGALCACYCVLLISYYLSCHAERLCRPLVFLGKNSIFMLCAHIIELNLFPWLEVFRRLGLADGWYLWYRIIGKFIWAITVTVICAKMQQKMKRQTGI